MAEKFADNPRKAMTDMVLRALGGQGYSFERRPGRGKANTWQVTKNGVTKTLAIRTSMNHWFAFLPEKKGSKWKTLDDVDLIAVATVDPPPNPQKVYVYLLKAQEVRNRFDAAYAARTKAGRIVRDEFGMWVCLYTPERKDMLDAVGGGIADNLDPIGTFPVAGIGVQFEEAAPQQQRGGPITISEILNRARFQIAEIAGVRPENIKLDLKIETN